MPQVSHVDSESFGADILTRVSEEYPDSNRNRIFSKYGPETPKQTGVKHSSGYSSLTRVRISAPNAISVLASKFQLNTNICSITTSLCKDRPTFGSFKYLHWLNLRAREPEFEHSGEQRRSCTTVERAATYVHPPRGIAFVEQLCTNRSPSAFTAGKNAAGRQNEEQASSRQPGIRRNTGQEQAMNQVCKKQQHG